MSREHGSWRLLDFWILLQFPKLWIARTGNNSKHYSNFLVLTTHILLVIKLERATIPYPSQQLILLSIRPSKSTNPTSNTISYRPRHRFDNSQELSQIQTGHLGQSSNQRNQIGGIEALVSQQRLSMDKLLGQQVKAMDQRMGEDHANISTILSKVTGIEETAPQKSLLEEILETLASQQRAAHRKAEISLRNEGILSETVRNLEARLNADSEIVRNNQIHMKQRLDWAESQMVKILDTLKNGYASGCKSFASIDAEVESIKEDIAIITADLSSLPGNYQKILENMENREWETSGLQHEVAEVRLVSQETLEQSRMTHTELTNLIQELWRRISVNNNTLSRNEQMVEQLEGITNDICQLISDFQAKESRECETFQRLSTVTESIDVVSQGQDDILAAIGLVPEKITALTHQASAANVQIRKLVTANLKLRRLVDRNNRLTRSGVNAMEELDATNMRLEEKLDQIIFLQTPRPDADTDTQIPRSLDSKPTPTPYGAVETTTIPEGNGVPPLTWRMLLICVCLLSTVIRWLEFTLLVLFFLIIVSTTSQSEFQATADTVINLPLETSNMVPSKEG